MGLIEWTKSIVFVWECDSLRFMDWSWLEGHWLHGTS